MKQQRGIRDFQPSVTTLGSYGQMLSSLLDGLPQEAWDAVAPDACSLRRNKGLRMLTSGYAARAASLVGKKMLKIWIAEKRPIGG